jgi:hypothetical protein
MLDALSESADTTLQLDESQDHPNAHADHDVLPASPDVQVQLSLFQTVYAPANVRERQSNVIEIWDAAPKYITPRRHADLRGKAPQVLERTFEFRGTRFRMRGWRRSYSRMPMVRMQCGSRPRERN